MNIILLLPKNESELLATYITNVLQLPAPAHCDNVEELILVYKTLKQVTIVSRLDIMMRELRKIDETIQGDGHVRYIVLPVEPFLSRTDLGTGKTMLQCEPIMTERFCYAIHYCNDPERYMYSVCLVGITYASFYNDPAYEQIEQPLIGVLKIIWPGPIEWGHAYLVIDKQLQKHYRRVFPSKKENHVCLKVDEKLTPVAGENYPPPVDMSISDIRAMFKITSETVSFF